MVEFKTSYLNHQTCINIMQHLLVYFASKSRYKGVLTLVKSPTRIWSMLLLALVFLQRDQRRTLDAGLLCKSGLLAVPAVVNLSNPGRFKKQTHSRRSSKDGPELYSFRLSLQLRPALSCTWLAVASSRWTCGWWISGLVWGQPIRAEKGRVSRKAETAYGPAEEGEAPK